MFFSKHWLLLGSVIIATGLAVSRGDEPATDWPATKTTERQLLGRKIVRYEHTCLKEWGPEDVTNQYFNVFLPQKDSPEPHPLLVFLHSLGGNGDGVASEDAVAAKLLNRGGPEFIGLMPNSPSTGLHSWWGYNFIKTDPAKYDHMGTPVEQRVLATIEWVVRKYNIDRNRIYLAGASMGGSGTLGLGMCHGDIFAALWACCTANSEHVMQRMHFPPPPKPAAAPGEQESYWRASAGVGLPDAPPIVAFVSQNDGSAKTMLAFVRAAQDGRQALQVAWGPWGHGYFAYAADPRVYQFPFLEIRKNAAYPVFTDASTDQQYPGINPTNTDPYGQINGGFRWKVVQDTPAEFAIELRLVQMSELSTNPPEPLRRGYALDVLKSVPDRSVTDVTLRRLQKFVLKPDVIYAWTFGSGKDALSGTLKPDLANLLTFKRLVITTEPTRLTIKRRL